MSTTIVTMKELESESAELLPSRETLCCPCCHPCGCGIEICVSICVF